MGRWRRFDRRHQRPPRTVHPPTTTGCVGHDTRVDSRPRSTGTLPQQSPTAPPFRKLATPYRCNFRDKPWLSLSIPQRCELAEGDDNHLSGNWGEWGRGRGSRFLSPQTDDENARVSEECLWVFNFCCFFLHLLLYLTVGTTLQHAINQRLLDLHSRPWPRERDYLCSAHSMIITNATWHRPPNPSTLHLRMQVTNRRLPSTAKIPLRAG